MKVNKHNVFRVTVRLCSKEERRNVNNFSTEAHVSNCKKIFLLIVKLTYSSQLVAKGGAPVAFWWPFWNENPVCLTGKGSNQCQVTTMPSHHFKNKCPLVTALEIPTVH